MGMPFKVKGCYIDLLILQFNNGKFTLAQAKHMLSTCFEVAWPMLEQKFKLDGEYYYNERLKLEIDKRKNFTESRRNNGLAKKKVKNLPLVNNEAYAKHMGNENENEVVIKDTYINSTVFFEKDRNLLFEKLTQPEVVLEKVLKTLSNDNIIFTKEELKTKIQAFIDFISANEDWGKPISEYRRHCNNWLLKKGYLQKQQKKGKVTVDDLNWD